MTTAQELITRINRAKQDLDRDSLLEMLDALHMPSDATAQPFDAAITLKPEVRAGLNPEGFESALAMNWANAIAKAERWVAYQLKMVGGFDGRIVVDDGDSWLQYPLLLTDVVDHLSARENFAMRSLSAGGDTGAQIAQRGEYHAALAKSGAEVLMLSMGGNDVLGDGGLLGALVPWRDGMSPSDALRHDVIDRALGRVMQNYRRVLTDVSASFPQVRVLGHGYDLPYPKEGGKWLGKPMAAKGIPFDAGREIVRTVLDRFAGALKQLEGEAPQFRYLDMRGVADLGENSWFDEIHPKDAGFGRVAEVFQDAIERVPYRPGLSGSTFENTSAGHATFESGPGHVIVLDPGHGGENPPPKVGGSSWNNAVGPGGLLEKTVTLDIAKRVRDILLSRGRTVVLTRETDVNLGLRARAAVAASRRADAFVSIHFNASTGHNAQGTETFVHSNRTDAAKDLCLHVQAAMVDALGYRDRNASHGGIKAAGFGVINPQNHNADTAAVLLEASFMDRANEEAKLRTNGHKSTIARALADGIDAYLGFGGFQAAFSGSPTQELGDAIEAAAFEADMSVPEHLSASPALAQPSSFASPASMDGARLMPQGGAGGDFADWIRRTERSGDIAGGAENSENDTQEFMHVDPGSGFDPITLIGVGGMDGGAELDQYQSASSGFDLDAFEMFIRSLGLRYFSPSEFLFMGASNAPGASCASKNHFPKQDLWQNIAAAAQMLDEIRHRLSAPIRINSAYRSPAYNACVNGAPGSHHMYFRAIDWRCSDGRTPSHWAKVAREVRASNSRYRGGIKSYSSFVHIDTRGYSVDF